MTGHLSRLKSPNLPNAACAKVDDPEIFFAEDCVNPNKETIEKARQICLECLDRVPCLMWGLNNESYGMWGGLTSNERLNLRARKMNKLKHLKDLGIF